MRKVLVLLSSYNGEKYIVSQVESILNQEGVEVDCLIRDDGSSDNTVSLIKDFIHKNKNGIYLDVSQNIGFARSFSELIKNASNMRKYDYYAFSDQDDVWMPGKLLAATMQLDSFDKNLPLLYCSNLKVVDSDLNYIREMNSTNTNALNKYSSLIKNIGTGCTEVFNYESIYFYLKTNFNDIYLHDYWMYLICSLCGNVVYDPESYILYRQHSANVLGSKHIGIFKRWKTYIISSSKIRKSLESNMAKSFLAYYSNNLSSIDCSLLRLISCYQQSFNKKIHLLFLKKIHPVGYTKSEQLIYILRVLFNRF